MFRQQIDKANNETVRLQSAVDTNICSIQRLAKASTVLGLFLMISFSNHKHQ